MMPNNKVNWQSLHTELMKQSEDRHAMELRLIDAFGQGLAGIRNDMEMERAANSTRVHGIEGDIVALKVADRKWGGVVGLFAAAVTAAGVWLGQR
jgi:hypothetical protein